MSLAAPWTVVPDVRLDASGTSWRSAFRARVGWSTLRCVLVAALRVARVRRAAGRLGACSFGALKLVRVADFCKSALRTAGGTQLKR
eukprot:8118481-Alexandrium_andersonii.AAC.1